MDPNQKINNLNELSDEIDAGETVSVDDFIRELEAKEKDLHIASDSSVIEIEDSFDDADDMPEIMREAIAARGIEPIAQSAEAAPAAQSKRDDLEATVSHLREQIEKLEADRDELFKTSQRRARDFETFKTRAERERKETFQSQVGNLATLMLPALDNLNRALDFAGETADEKGVEFKQFFDGIVLVNQQVNDVFEKMGVTSIPTVGEEFDPHLHEAVATEVNDELPPNTISAELLRGYRMGDKVIRHSMVKVSQASPQDKTPAAIHEAADDSDEADECDDPETSQSTDPTRSHE